MNGDVELSMPPETEESNGMVELTIEGLNLGDGKTSVDIPRLGALTLDRANLGDLELVVNIEEGTAKIEKGQAHGQDLKLDLLGKVRLLRPLKRSEANLMARVKIEDAYKERSPKVATMLELASAGLKSAMTPDGALQYTISGAVGGRLRPRASGSAPFKAPN